MDSSPLVVGIDLGGTKLAALLSDRAGTPLHRVWHEHQATDYEDVLASIAAAVAECATVAAGAGRPVAGLGVAVAGPLDRPRERVVKAVNLPIVDRPVGADLARRTGLPVVLENDANAAALAEARHGAGVGAAALVVLTIGTGIGGGIVLDGQVVIGGRGGAAELGHLPVGADDMPCGCGSVGCLEQYASGTGIARQARLAAAAGRAPYLAALVDGATDTITSRHVVVAARAADPVATGLLADAGTRIGRALACLAATLDPDLVLLTGGTAHAAADFLLPAVTSALARQWPFREQGGPAPVRLARCGEEAGAVGAAVLAGDRFL